VDKRTADDTQHRQGTGRIILKNAISLTMAEIAIKVLTFAFNVYVVRRLGDDRFGQYSIVLAFTGLFSILLELGMTQYVMREIARDRSRAQALLWNLVVMRLILAVVGIVGMTWGATIAGYAPVLVLGVLIHSCSYLLSAFHAPLIAVISANERLDYVAGLSILGRMVFVVAGGALLLSGASFIALIVANLLGLPLQIALAIRLIRRQRMADLAFHIDPRAWLSIVRGGLPFGFISLMLTISFSISTVVLSMHHAENVVGWYNVAYHLMGSLMFFTGGFNEAIVPSLSRTYVSEPRQVEQWYHRSVRLIVVTSLPMATGGMLLAVPIIRLLYGETFMPSAAAFAILIWDMPLLMFCSFCGNMTTVIGQERAAGRVYAVNAAVNVLLDLYAIPRYGILGAAVVTVLTDLVGTIQFHLLLGRRLNLPDMRPVIGRVVLATGVMGTVVALAGGVHLFIRIGLGVMTYLIMAPALHLLDDVERALLARGARRLARLFRLHVAEETV
jgi:O-antigen/teichoic acid export membrane protein